MNKKIVIVTIIIIALIIIGILVWLDFTRIIEEKKEYSLDTTKYAYTVKEDTNEISFTIYGNLGDAVKTVYIYRFENDLVKSIGFEKHYQNKLQAKGYFKEEKEKLEDAKIEKNIIKGTILNSAEVGKTRQEIQEMLVDFEKIGIKI